MNDSGSNNNIIKNKVSDDNIVNMFMECINVTQDKYITIPELEKKIKHYERFSFIEQMFNDIGKQCLQLQDKGYTLQKILVEHIVYFEKDDLFVYISMDTLSDESNDTSWMEYLSLVILSFIHENKEVALTKIIDSSLYFAIQRCLHIEKESRRFIFI